MAALTGIRLASGFWAAAKVRQIQNSGGYASILVKGNEEAGAINLILRARDGSARLATSIMDTSEASGERSFEWRDGRLDDVAVSALIKRELAFDRDQWFIECECSEGQFLEIFKLMTR